MGCRFQKSVVRQSEPWQECQPVCRNVIRPEGQTWNRDAREGPCAGLQV